MKTAIYFLFLMLSINVLIAQQRAILPLELKDYALKSDYVNPNNLSPDLPVYKAPKSMISTMPDEEITEDIIGSTFYDLQSNASLQNRMYCYDDGTVGAVWTMGMQSTTFPDRGTGYNFYNGSTWLTQPEVRIETFRAGWPSYAPWGANGEIVVSHNFAALSLYFMTRPEKGTGPWDQKLFTYTNGPTTLAWPRIITNGDDHNTVHLLTNTGGTYLGQAYGIVYSRSLDGGTSWDIENELLDGTGSEFYTEITADQYVWANPVGDTIAFLVASAWHDLFMMKSVDNGDSWEKTVIWEHPYPLFDWNVTITDTIFCVDNSASIALDRNGKAHVVFGINRVIHNVVGTNYSYFPYIDGIGYWNEDMPTFSNDLNALAPPQYGYPNSELTEDVNYIGWTQDVDGDGEITFIATSSGFPMAYRELGVSTMPSITIGPDNEIAVVFSSTTETYDNSEWNYKKLWLRDKPSGMNWGSFIHLTADLIHIFDESVYPVVYPTWKDYIHILYNNDPMPGTALDENHNYISNVTTYMKVALYPIGVEENHPPGEEPISLIVFPNPSKDMVNTSYSLTRASEVSMTVSDISGRAFIDKTLGWKNAGDYRFSFDLENLRPGIYLISLKTSHQSITKKLVIN
jgi:hypothetical protein